MSQETDRVFQRQLQKLQLEEQAAVADYNAHLFSGDTDSAGDAMLQVAQARNQRNVLIQEYQAELERGQYRAPYVSDEQRAARQPNEMDAEDCAALVRTSKYSKNFTSQDYDALRRGLTSYKTMRGTENK
jgi:hypothetical protein